jgi:hypothetical protein
MPTTPAVRVRVSDELARSRLTVFFRLLLAIPHLLWLAVWGIGALACAIVNWLVTLVQGTPPLALHRFLAAYVRYSVQVYAYLYLAANPYPPFDGRPGYPVEVELEPPQRQNRWTVGFRIVLAIPAVLVAGALTGSVNVGGSSSSAAGLLTVAGVLGWFAALFTARMPRGLRDAAAYAIAYGAQLSAYLFVITDRYPTADPATVLGALPVRTDPIGIAVRDDLRRSRLTVFFRLLLALPHLVWLSLWGIAATVAAIATWVATLVQGTPPAALHRFLSAYLRYATQVVAYVHLVANPFPGFTGTPGSYPVELAIGTGPQRQNRWTVAFRIVLFVPALLLASAYGSLLLAVAVLGWFAGLFTARMPEGLRNAGALALRYGGQAYGYLFMLTERYPYSGPSASAAADVPPTGLVPSS